MTFEVRVTGRVEKDVDTIFEWLAKRSKDGAVRWYLAYLNIAAFIADSGRRMRDCL